MKCAWLGIAAFVLSACGPASRGAVAFDGRPSRPLVTAGDLQEVRELPAGYRTLGEVSASCTLTMGSTELRAAWLSDVDCTEARLRSAVRERAAAVGAELLVGSHCKAEPRGRRGDIERTAILCRAEAARPRSETLARRELAPPPVVPWGEAPPAATEAWHIRVDYTPAAGVAPRAPRSAASINEVASLPTSHRRLGDVITRCARDCTEQGAYAGLLAAAGRMGASDIADVGCVSRGAGWLCSAVAAGYRVDPERDPAAR